MTDKEKCEELANSYHDKDFQRYLSDTEKRFWKSGWQAALRESPVCLAMYARLKELIKEDYENQMDKKAVEDYEKAII